MVGADAPVSSPTIPPGVSTSAFLAPENTSGTAKIEGLKLLGHPVPAPGRTGTPPAITVEGTGTELHEAGWTIGGCPSCAGPRNPGRNRACRGLV